MLVSEEEHHSARVIQLIHLVEVGHLRNVDEIDHGKQFNLRSYFEEGLERNARRKTP